MPIPTKDIGSIPAFGAKVQTGNLAANDSDGLSVDTYKVSFAGGNLNLALKSGNPNDQLGIKVFADLNNDGKFTDQDLPADNHSGFGSLGERSIYERAKAGTYFVQINKGSASNSFDVPYTLLLSNTASSKSNVIATNVDFVAPGSAQGLVLNDKHDSDFHKIHVGSSPRKVTVTDSGGIAGVRFIKDNGDHIITSNEVLKTLVVSGPKTFTFNNPGDYYVQTFQQNAGTKVTTNIQVEPA